MKDRESSGQGIKGSKILKVFPSPSNTIFKLCAFVTLYLCACLWASLIYAQGQVSDEEVAQSASSYTQDVSGVLIKRHQDIISGKKQSIFTGGVSGVLTLLAALNAEREDEQWLSGAQAAGALGLYTVSYLQGKKRHERKITLISGQQEKINRGLELWLNRRKNGESEQAAVIDSETTTSAVSLGEMLQKDYERDIRAKMMGALFLLGSVGYSTYQVNRFQNEVDDGKLSSRDNRDLAIASTVFSLYGAFHAYKFREKLIRKKKEHIEKMDLSCLKSNGLQGFTLCQQKK